MKDDSSPEMRKYEEVNRERRKVIETWASRREQEHDIETVMNRLRQRKIIKEYGPRHLVIKTNIVDRLWTIWVVIIFTYIIGGVIGVLFLYLPISEFIIPLCITISVIWGLYFLGRLVGIKCQIDGLTESIIVEKRPFLFIHKKSVIPFLNVKSVIFDYEPAGLLRSWPYEDNTSIDFWTVSLSTAHGKVKIYKSKKLRGARDLADALSNFIGKKLEYSRDKTDPFSPPTTFDIEKLPRNWKL